MRIHSTVLPALVLFAAAWLGGPVARAAESDVIPSGTVVIVVPFVAGGATDIMGRYLAEALTSRWGRPVIVENRAGASGMTGSASVAKSKPDGRTLLLGTNTALAVMPSLSKSLPYDVAKDFTPITLLVTSPMVLLVSDKTKVTSVQELVRKLKENPNKFSYGTSGIGTSQHFAALLLLNQINAEAVHVPYKGTGQFMVDMAGGQLDFGFDNLTTALSTAKQGRVKALAVTSAQRSPLAPELPTLIESGVPNFDTKAITWLGLLGPAGLPEPAAEFINREVTSVLADPAFQSKLIAQGFTPRPMKAPEFRQFIRSETERFADLIRKNNVVIE